MERIDIIPDKEFVKNMSDELLEELIQIKDAIPSEIRESVMDYREHNINDRRLSFLVDNEDLIGVDRYEREMTYEMNKPLEANNFRSRYALAFVKKHPQFKPMIKEVRIVKV